MTAVRHLFTSSIGRKFLMAVTGVVLVLFLIGHVSGNLLVFGGPSATNAYAEWLQQQGPVLWGVRAFLLAVFVLHIWLGAALKRENAAARGVEYAKRHWVRASFASRSMFWTGLLVLAFVVYHLAHFTFGFVQPDAYTLQDANGRHDVYKMTVLGFQSWIIVISYVVALLILGVHLWHGVCSFFQSLGIRHPRYTPVLEKLGLAFTVLLIAGYLAIPFAVLAGWLRPDVHS